MASTSDLVVYAHLTPTTHPDQICETLKLSLKRGPDPETSQQASEEESKVDEGDKLGDSIDDLASQVRDFLTEHRNDGNKNYEILAISASFMGVPLPLGLTASSVLTNGGDVYVTVRI